MGIESYVKEETSIDKERRNLRSKFEYEFFSFGGEIGDRKHEVYFGKGLNQSPNNYKAFVKDWCIIMQKGETLLRYLESITSRIEPKADYGYLPEMNISLACDFLDDIKDYNLLRDLNSSSAILSEDHLANLPKLIASEKNRNKISLIINNYLKSRK